MADSTISNLAIAGAQSHPRAVRAERGETVTGTARPEGRTGLIRPPRPG